MYLMVCIIDNASLPLTIGLLHQTKLNLLLSIITEKQIVVFTHSVIGCVPVLRFFRHKFDR